MTVAWRAITNPTHVYPVDDLRDHETDGESCWCNPTDDDGILVHHSLDKREEYERGRMKS